MLHAGRTGANAIAEYLQEPIYLLDPKAPLPLHCEVKHDMQMTVVIQ